jgi:YebC/PmpR family DNA-binding regulatory protein
MAGHSHSANIAVRKGKQDAARARTFSKLARYIIVAAKNGGGDPDTNLRLRYAIDKARSVSMPKENIERAIKRGTGDLEGVVFDEITYEGYGPGGVAIMVETLTDNRNRTSGDVRIIFDKNGGSMGNAGCVAYLFDRKGIILLDAKAYPDEDAVMTAALEAEAGDCVKHADVYEITTDLASFSGVREKLAGAGFTFLEAEVKLIPQTTAKLDLETGKKVMKLIEALENNDDVQTVTSNADITDEMMD